MIRSRDSNLDFLRALAIVAVVAYHMHGMWPTKYPTAAPFADLGKYGVTLFFVLSGWLIGGIFWRDRDHPTSASTFNFWVRRWLRTIPPYLAGMALAYLAVRVGREQSFDLRYLYFGQNYAQQIPFYWISWSLCVEEHFYLFLPLIGFVALRMPKRVAFFFLWTLPMLSPLLRVLDPNVIWPSPFGYSKTATHLVAEGLGLGVASAFTFYHYPRQWIKIQSIAKYVAFPLFLLFVSVAFWSSEAEFFVGQTFVALFCFVLLAATAGQRELPFASCSLVYAIAISSYSVYLTHSLAIHIALRLARASGSVASEISCLAIWISTIALAGAVFYYSVERTSIKLRDLVSKRFLVIRPAPLQLTHKI